MRIAVRGLGAAGAVREAEYAAGSSGLLRHVRLVSFIRSRVELDLDGDVLQCEVSATRSSSQIATTYLGDDEPDRVRGKQILPDLLICALARSLELLRRGDPVGPLGPRRLFIDVVVRGGLLEELRLEPACAVDCDHRRSKPDPHFVRRLRGRGPRRATTVRRAPRCRENPKVAVPRR